MRPIINSLMTALVIAVMIAPVASATPAVDSAVFNLRVFNDCPTSILTTGNNYPSSVWIQDTQLNCNGWANLHNWHLAVGGSEAVFNNGDDFSFSTELRISGPTDGEAGLQLSPWWSHNVDGRFNVRSTDGEIACFGGRLPFFSFTGTFGLAYVKGDWIRLTIVYTSNGLTQLSPADIQYIVDYHGATYASPRLPFDEGNPDEDPPFGLWGILNDARVGGYCQLFIQPGNPDAGVLTEWANIEFENYSIATEDHSWSQIKSLY